MENRNLLTKISTLTIEIETKYPEVYEHLDEIPQTIPDVENPEVEKKELAMQLFFVEAGVFLVVCLIVKRLNFPLDNLVFSILKRF